MRAKNVEFLDFELTQPYKDKNKYKLVPNYNMSNFNDVIIKGGKFFAAYNEHTNLWTKNVSEFIEILDEKMLKKYKEIREEFEQSNNRQNKENWIGQQEVKKLENRDDRDLFSRSVSKYYQEMLKVMEQIENKNEQNHIDHIIKFSNSEINKNDFSTGSLNYALEEGSTDNWDYLIGTLYEPEEKQKIEWMIGSIVSGESKTLQKFYVLYGDAGTGKSTLLNIIQSMFYKYWSPFDSARLVSTSEFALDSIASDPLISIQHDGDLSKIVHNERLNMIVSHENIVINEKRKQVYTMKPQTVLILGTNSPVKITDAKAGIKRRLIDIHPSGRLIPINEYDNVFHNIINFERGPIAYKCLGVFKKLGRNFYKDYVPIEMEYRTNDFFNFVDENYDLFLKEDGIALSAAFLKYKEYCDENPSMKRMTKMQFRDELKNYFYDFGDIYKNRVHIRNYYQRFRKEKFEKFNSQLSKVVNEQITSWINFNCTADNNTSKLDELLAEQPAQYSIIDENGKERPKYTWPNCSTKLRQLNTSMLHYVLGLKNLIFIDFDKKNEYGEKDFSINFAEASKWPKTYVELSKSGKALHSYYFYNGDVSKLDTCYNGDKDIEIKKCTGKSPIRRLLTRFNDLDIATLPEGSLPLKEEKEYKWEDKDVENMSDIQLEKGLRTTIIKCLLKRVHTSTVMNVSWIKEILDKAYACGKTYDVSDLYNDVLVFGMKSSHQSDKCLDMISEMHFKSKNLEEANAGVDEIEQSEYDEPMELGAYKEDGKIVFFDVEVFPNLFLFGYKFLDGEKHYLFNPPGEKIRELFSRGYRWVGFNCRNYDNHIVWAAMNDLSPKAIWRQSQQIINSPKGSKDNGKYGSAYNLSYTDIYDYAKTKQSLKKWEIQLKIFHKELEYDWNSDIPEELWPQVQEYNGYDLDATEAVWKATQSDFTTRLILADIAGGCPNDTDNMLTAKLIFGKEKEPQKYFHYRNLSEPVLELDPEEEEFLKEVYPEMMAERHGEAQSYLPYFPGYHYEKLPKPNEEGETIRSIYKDEETGEGGLVRAEPGIYGFSKTFDVASEHPNSACSEYLFGKFTRIYYSLVGIRLAIKHKEYSSLEQMFEGRLMKYLTNKAEAKKLSKALKTPINAVYGLTKAAFVNKFRDIRNEDNIVAKRGALFMIDLRDEVEKRGYKVFHIKTDSLKVVNPTPEIEEFIYKFGKRYGYEFEVEHVFEKIALVNNAVYIAKVSEDDVEWKEARDEAIKEGKDIPTRWTATGAQFAEPYVFKTLFSHQPIEFDDYCLIKNVSKGKLYLDFNEGLPDVSIPEKVKELRKLRNDEKESKMTKKEISLLEDYDKYSDEQLEDMIAVGHNYVFIGKVGEFCPVYPGNGGADLVCLNDNGTYVSPTGTKDLKWMESSYISRNGLQDIIDLDYFNSLVNDAVESIKNSTIPNEKKGFVGHGTFEGFIE